MAQHSAKACLSFGNTPVNWAVRHANAENGYSPGGIVCRYNAAPLEVPDWLLAARREVEAELGTSGPQPSVAGSTRPTYNGFRYALACFRVLPSTASGGRLLLCFRPSDYFTLLACYGALDRAVMPSESGDCITPRQYLDAVAWAQPIASFAPAFGVTLAVVTQDGFLVVARRSPDVRFRPGEFSASVSEGLDAADADPATGSPDPYACAVRGAWEELGIEVAADEVQMLSFGADTDTNQWGLLGLVHARLPASCLLQSYQLAADASEQSIEFVRFAPGCVIDYVAERGPWAPEGVACIVHALERSYGADVVECATRRWRR